MKLTELYEYLKENLYTTVADALKVNHFLISEDDSLLVQLPYSSNFVFKFYCYLQLRIFIRHGHLIPDFDMNAILQNAGEFTSSYVDLPAKNLCQILKDEIHMTDDKLYLGLKYLANDGNAAWELSAMDNVVMIRDFINGWDDGSVLENYLSDYDEVSPWQQNILEHFGGYMDANHVCYEFEVNAPDDFIKGIINYLYMTVLISSGHRYMK